MKYIIVLLFLITACKSQKEDKTPPTLDFDGEAWHLNDSVWHTLPGKGPCWADECPNLSGSYMQASAAKWPINSVVGGFSGDSIEVSIDGVIHKFPTRKVIDVLYGENSPRRGHSSKLETLDKDSIITVGGYSDMGYGLSSPGWEPGSRDTSFLSPLDSTSPHWMPLILRSYTFDGSGQRPGDTLPTLKADTAYIKSMFLTADSYNKAIIDTTRSWLLISAKQSDGSYSNPIVVPGYKVHTRWRFSYGDGPTERIEYLDDSRTQLDYRIIVWYSSKK